MAPQGGKLFNIGNYRYYSDVYIETGAGAGGSISRALQAGFPEIHSIEANERLYQYVKQRYPKANLHLGLSENELPRILGHCNVPSVFFLDAHPAGKDTYGHEQCLAGEPNFLQHNILIKELGFILSHRKDHLVIIDDQTPDTILPYVDLLLAANSTYSFSLLDEQLNETEPFFPDKILVAIPEITLI